MVLNMYAVRDVRTQAYLKPVFVQNDSVLERALKDGLDDENSLFHHHPEDYQVFRLGEYDDSTGTVTAQPPEHMYNLVDLQEK